VRAAKIGGTKFNAVNPATGVTLDPDFYAASLGELDKACRLAADAAGPYGKLSGRARAAFLRQIALGLEAEATQITERANAETALPMPRLTGELGRTTGQLRMFADMVEEGSWVDARLDSPLPNRSPAPRPDIRAMLRPIGPVAVFGASNFPLAFSVAGGDTASALAAGNPVIVKAHPAHPGTSELVGLVIKVAAAETGMPDGVFSLLFDQGKEIAQALVMHSAVKAVAFTGSLGAGRALMDLAAARPDPIVCFTEMGSTNPVFILPGALRERNAAIAKGLVGSITVGSGQFCTQPGLVVLPNTEDALRLVSQVSEAISAAPPATMLTGGISGAYAASVSERKVAKHVSLAAEAVETPTSPYQTRPAVFQVDAADFLNDRSLSGEIFGPTSTFVRCTSADDATSIALALEGHLTATVHGTDEDLQNAAELISVLERKVGRIVINGYPTGVEVCHAMVHGGPYPATSDSRFTSVGSNAIFRFVRPVCYQDFPQHLLPDELKDGNPLGIHRFVDGEISLRH
jgi:NADP-dependent aldehyde dehydrogenase